MEDITKFKQIYINECFEFLSEMEEKLLELDPENPSHDELNAIFRCAHSIKGGAGVFGFEHIIKFTHVVEEMLESLRSNKIQVNNDIVDALLKSVDILEHITQAADKEEPINDTLYLPLAQKLQNLANEQSGKLSSIPDGTQDNQERTNVMDISFNSKENLFTSGSEPLLILVQLAELGKASVTLDSSRVPEIEDIDYTKSYLDWSIRLETKATEKEVAEVFEFVDDCCEFSVFTVAEFTQNLEDSSQDTKQDLNEKPCSPPKTSDTLESAKPRKTVNSIRVNVDKMDKLANMVGEIAITQSMIISQSKSLPPEKYASLLKSIDTLSQNTMQLQESVMSARMQPVKILFSRFPRLIRDLSGQLGKNIKVEISGEETELDRAVTEQLIDPLTHMIRNSIDHGITPPDHRKAIGKPPQGTISLSAEHQSGNIVIKVADDGQGIDRNKVLAKAANKGIVDQASILPDKEIDTLIFAPGFSTADAVSDISGRGVGMDVVKQNVESIGGSIDIENHPEIGLTFIVTIPLTMAILDGMVARCGSEKYIIPVANMVEALKVESISVNKVGNAGESVNFRGEYLPVLYLNKIFSVESYNPKEELFVFVESGNTKYALVVNELLGKQQAVIKSLEENFYTIPGIAAATILGDGSIALIIDILGIFELNKRAPQKQLEHII